MRELALFAGAGLGILGGKLLGWRTVCAVEFDEHARAVLAARQNDGSLAPFPIWDDVRTFDGRPWKGVVDVVSGGFPCQDISVAGNGDGLDGERSGLWREMSRIVGEVRPRHVLVENSPALTGRGLGTVLGDLAALGYDARWGVLGAADAGAPHQRDRIWIVATDPRQAGRKARGLSGRAAAKQSAADHAAGHAADAHGAGREELRRSVADGEEYAAAECAGWWAAEPGVVRMVHGVPLGVDRVERLGNGQVSDVVPLAWHVVGGFPQ